VYADCRSREHRKHPIIASIGRRCNVGEQHEKGIAPRRVSVEREFNQVVASSGVVDHPAWRFSVGIDMGNEWRYTLRERTALSVAGKGQGR
jgi:hypothetical protein